MDKNIILHFCITSFLRHLPRKYFILSELLFQMLFLAKNNEKRVYILKNVLPWILF